MFGTVEKGRTNTRFHLAVIMTNGCEIFQVVMIPNNELEAFPGLYGYTLDKMTAKLDERLTAHYQEWMRQ